MLKPTDLGHDDEDLARRVLVRARDIAPCLDSLEGERREDAIAILKAVLAEIPAPGSRRVKSKSRNGTAITFADPGSWFGPDDLSSLRSLCRAATVPGLPVGSFPTSRAFAGFWPEEPHS